MTHPDLNKPNPAPPAPPFQPPPQGQSFTDWVKAHKVVAAAGGAALFVVAISFAASAATAPVAPSRAAAVPTSQKGAAAPPVAAPAASVAAPGGNVPDLIGKGLPSAQTILRTAGFTAITAHDSGSTGRMQFNDPNWKVCFQDPKPGQYAVSTPIDLGVVKRAEECPVVDGTAAGKLGATPTG